MATTKFSEPLALEICEWLADGGSLRSFCKQSGKPGTTTVKRWLAENEKFRAQYAQAREDQAESYADAIVQIADDLEIAPEHKRVMIDARKWTASKLLPKKYGDKLDLEHSGEIIVKFEHSTPQKVLENKG